MPMHEMHEYMTIAEAAESWGVSVRRVQSLCRDGAIPDAVRFGHAWMIPRGASKPSDRRTKQARAPQPTLSVSDSPMPRKAPFLDMTDLYTVPGSADGCIAALAEHPVAQALFAAEIAYSRGEISKVYERAKYFLKEHSDFYAVNAGGMLLALAAMWRGDIHLYREAKIHICAAPANSEDDRSIMALSLACVDSAVRDISNYPKWFARGRFGHLPPDSHPAARVFYLKYLLVFAQDMAKSRFRLPDVTGLGLMKSIPYIAEPMITQTVVEGTIIPEIYLRLLVAIAYHQCGDEESAVEHVDRAIALALPDRLLGILAEHRRQLDYLLDDRLMLADPRACRKYRELHKMLLDGWTRLHNSLLSKSVSRALTIKEREIARLAAFGLSNAQIAKQLHITVDSAKQAIYDAMNKTGVNEREELGAFV